MKNHNWSECELYLSTNEVKQFFQCEQCDTFVPRNTKHWRSIEVSECVGGNDERWKAKLEFCRDAGMIEKKPLVGRDLESIIRKINQIIDELVRREGDE